MCCTLIFTSKINITRLISVWLKELCSKIIRESDDLVYFNFLLKHLITDFENHFIIPYTWANKIFWTLVKKHEVYMINLNNKSTCNLFCKFHALFSIFDTVKCIFCQLWVNFPFAFNENSALSSQLLQNYKTS